MLNKLQAINPYRYDLLAENQIQSYISYLSEEEKKKLMQTATKRIGCRQIGEVVDYVGQCACRSPSARAVGRHPLFISLPFFSGNHSLFLGHVAEVQ